MRTFNRLVKSTTFLTTALIACSVSFAHGESLLTGPHWDDCGDERRGGFGWSFADAGDVNGDGWDDIIVGALSYTPDLSRTRVGGVFVYYGGPEGLSEAADWSVFGDQTDSHFGRTVSGVGDVNGDGFDDVIVGAPRYDNCTGRVFLYYGGETGLSQTHDWDASGAAPYSDFGYSLSAAGNINGDEYDDFIVGAPRYGDWDRGRVYVYLGGETILSAPALDGNENAAEFGWSVSYAGDVDGDDCDDIVVGERVAGKAYVYRSQGSGFSSDRILIECNKPGSIEFGFSVAGAGDITGDGLDDIIIGDPKYTNGQTEEGGAFVYHWNGSGFSTSDELSVESDIRRARLGYSVAGAGDVNGDGYHDVIIGEPYYPEGNESGRVHVYYGGESRLGQSPVSLTSIRSVSNGHFGQSVSSVGDVNGDYVADIIVGAPAEEDGGIEKGCAYIYYGKTDYMVKNTLDLDEAPGSLRYVINQANNETNSGTIVIGFDIDGVGPHTIQPTLPLPTIERPVVINGYSQPGASPNTNQPGQGTNATLKIELNGSQCDMASGLNIVSHGCIVRGLAINSFDIAGISVGGGGEHTIEGNFIGTDCSGTNLLANGINGVKIVGSSKNTIGGRTLGTCNVISGNGANGIAITGSSASDNAVLGNYIGVDATGIESLGNRASGIYIRAARNNTIGGSEDEDRNVISDNKRGILISHNAIGNVIEGNYIGTDAMGTGEVGNTLSGITIVGARANEVRGNVISGNYIRGVFLHGADDTILRGNIVGLDASCTFRRGNKGDYAILIDGGQGNFLGGTDAGSGNVISGNDGWGIRIYNGVTGTVVQGNYIGTNRDYAEGLGNAGGGVLIDLDASNNTIGGTTEGSGNTIAYNASCGVMVQHSTDNVVLSNSISSNGGLGIDLGAWGIAPNDEDQAPFDEDTGANGLQNFPVITAVTINTTRIQGTLKSTRDTSFRLQFFSNSECDPSGNGEGELFLGEQMIATGANGEADFDFTCGSAVPVGHFVTATATDPDGNTSEFSECFEVN